MALHSLYLLLDYLLAFENNVSENVQERLVGHLPLVVGNNHEAFFQVSYDLFILILQLYFSVNLLDYVYVNPVQNPDLDALHQASYQVDWGKSRNCFDCTFDAIYANNDAAKAESECGEPESDLDACLLEEKNHVEKW